VLRAAALAAEFQLERITYMMLAKTFVSTSAGIALILGMLHLVFTFSGPKLRPRDPELQSRMASVAPVISSQTTIWNAWIGFNASHSLGLLLFGAAYAYLALAQPTLLFNSPFLGLVGALFLAGYVVLAKVFWFNTPFWAMLLAFICYGVGLAAAQA
jgi:hypothetical protein